VITDEGRVGELAAQLGARDVLDTRDSVTSVHGMLAAFPGQWLLMFDNAPDRESVEQFLPPATPGRVLITSCNALWPPGQAVEVPVLDLQAAAGSLAARTGDADHQAAAALAETVGGLPLTLEQPTNAVDLGCGPRGSPGGRVVGVDTDQAHVAVAAGFTPSLAPGQGIGNLLHRSKAA
jgi:hypothetical protein